ncbi:hypothetical protein [Microbacterium sp. 1.5R]|uniref:hypothetical protein n=1 Tax=Microbacterium sp. 1.5R TaxID=1916917 RepID=UPI00119F08B0|nr:hypothetical protein [Microbacterium sp. 1.5R]
MLELRLGSTSAIAKSMCLHAVVVLADVDSEKRRIMANASEAHVVEFRIGLLADSEITRRLKSELARLLEAEPYDKLPWMITSIDSDEVADAYPDLWREAALRKR